MTSVLAFAVAALNIGVCHRAALLPAPTAVVDVVAQVDLPPVAPAVVAVLVRCCAGELALSGLAGRYGIRTPAALDTTVAAVVGVGVDVDLAAILGVIFVTVFESRCEIRSTRST